MRTSIHRIVLATLTIALLAAPGIAQTKKRTRPKPKPKPAPVKVNPALKPMVGTWYTVDANGAFVKANKFVFVGSGTFKYVGPGWSSEGTFGLKAKALTLTWIKVDGQKVAKPFSKTLALSEDGKTFPIERFTYKKAS